ncbi:GNAT family N-acetyltransferase [Rubricoccus marinus]|uniref:GNAT family N-acetyltransferase n=1 Tax=Rubricoccus marinus TaxID=716817 RepID=A0A259U3W2_9BACT|nr:GNAT family N-acetyltransferase [Rubricoccus marinus]OZC04640.1 GNAT family N-acetyltransferase [Rubricoccus marinus]
MQDSADFEIRDTQEGLTPGRIATLYRRAPLLRQTDDADRLRESFERSQLVLSAWQGDRLVGLARVLTDGYQVSYLCDLAVEPDVQGTGLGKKLIDTVLERCKGTELVLRDSNLSTGFYAHLGFKPIENGWVRRA